jgi:hypothetical protein
MGAGGRVDCAPAGQAHRQADFRLGFRIHSEVILMRLDRRMLTGCALTVVMAIGSSGIAQETKEAAPAAAPATEDIVVMLDGRILNGQILSETSESIVFQYTDKTLNITTKLSLRKTEIDKIQRDVPLPESSQPAAEASTPLPEKKAEEKKESDTIKSSRFGEVQKITDPNVPAFYIVPMKGQMGTDVHSQVYEKIRDDIRAMPKKPDVIVIELDSKDVEDLLYSRIGREERSLADLDDYRDLVNVLRDDLADIRQVVWVKDSVGVSSIVAMAWDEVYMDPQGRIGGMDSARAQTGFDQWQDEDVRGKMTAAFMSWIKGFFEKGNHPLELADSMVRPEFLLSASFKGREVIWTQDGAGEYVVDPSDESTVSFRAKVAEDLGISLGSPATYDDLAFLLGYREYRILDEAGKKIVDDYVADWRRLFDSAKSWWGDFEKFMGWASGPDQLKYLGQAKSMVGKILDAMNRYKAIEVRWQIEMGMSKLDLEVLDEQLAEQIRQLKNAGRGGDDGGGGAGRGRGGGGLGGGR